MDFYCSSAFDRLPKMFSVRHVYFILLLAISWYSGPVFGQGNFTVDGSSYNCDSTMICWNGAHRYTSDSYPQYDGRLSLIPEEAAYARQSSTVAYYKEPVRMLDPTAGLVASFNTTFTIDQVMELWDPNDLSKKYSGDGFTFVMINSSDQSTLGTPAKCLGIYDGTGRTRYKTVVVEFDMFQNPEAPINDISGNHVSVDLMNISFVAASNASDVNITLWAQETLYAWIEYSAETRQFEVRISRQQSRPIDALLNYEMNLSDVVDEFMWVGFSSGNGDHYSLYYVGNWTFESYGVPPVQKRRKSSQSSAIVAVAVAVPSLVIIAGLATFFLVRRRKRATAILGGSPHGDSVLQMSGMPESFSYKHLSVATGGFSEESKLGQGGFGSVYRGVLPASGTPVAVKKVSSDSRQGEREFIAEVSIISQLRHRNLIQLLGWCKDRGKYLLVYELMPKGSLNKVLFNPDEKQPVLSWSQRLNIVRGTAAALDYLHQGWKQQVIHRDVKASNIMLDADWNAKLGDFGLARLVDHQRQAATTLVAGTYGYIAPEAAISGKFTDKTDVFAFGAVALEIVCGRAAFAGHAPPEEIVLVDWVWQRLSEGDLLSVVDRRLDVYDTYWVEVVLLMGLLCSHPNPTARLSMRHVVQVLAGDVQVPSVPVSKPAAVFAPDTEWITISDLHSFDTTGTMSSNAPTTGSSGSATETTCFMATVLPRD